jgi:hypothetical protein
MFETVLILIIFNGEQCNIISDSLHCGIYEEESVNRSQMDIKRKECDIRTWKEHLFPDIFSTNIETFVPVRRNPQHRCLLTVASATSAPGRASSATFGRT